MSRTNKSVYKRNRKPRSRTARKQKFLEKEVQYAASFKKDGAIREDTQEAAGNEA